MTREEAIKTIQKFMGWFKEDSLIRKALEMAIQALSQEPCERFEWGIDGNVYKITKAKDGKEICQQVCDDAISRDWLKTAIHNFYYGLKHTPSEEDIQAYIDAAPSVTQNPIECDNAVNRILQRMWNCRGKHTTSIDKVKMEQIIRDELSSVTSKPIECNDTVSRGVLEQVMRERDIAIDQLHELGYELGQKIEPCGNAISRSDMLDAVGHGTTYTSEEVQKIVNNLSPVTPQQKSGHWIHFAQSDDCSECGWSTGKYISPSNYCPNCGAKMESEEEE